MIIYKCLVSGDEMFSDIYKISVSADGYFYEVEGKCICRKVGDIDDCLIGGNASAETMADGTDSSSESGVDIVLNHNLAPTTAFTKKSFMAYLKPYMKALKVKVQEADSSLVDKFQEDALKASKAMLDMVVKNQELQYFTGESMNAEGAVGILDYRDDGTTPFMIFLKWGLETEKC